MARTSLLVCKSARSRGRRIECPGVGESGKRQQVAGAGNMASHTKVRFIEPGSRPGRAFNAWVTTWPLLGPVALASVLERSGVDAAVPPPGQD